MTKLAKNKIRILHIDDDKEFVETIKFLLGDDYQVEQSDSTLDAVRKISQFKPNIVLLDLEFPTASNHEMEKQGVTLLGELKVDPAYKHIPIIIITHNSSEEVKTCCINSGANGYFIKPIQMGELMRALDNVVLKGGLK